MKLKIAGKLFLTYLLVILLTLLTLAMSMNPLLKDYLLTEKKTEIYNKALEISRLSQNYYNEEIDETTYLQLLETVDRVIDSRIMLIDRDGLLVAGSQNALKGGQHQGRTLAKGMKLGYSDIRVVLSGQSVIKEGISPHFNAPMIWVFVPVFEDGMNGQVTGAVLTFSPILLVTETLNKAYYLLAISSLAAVVLAALLSLYLSRKITLPLQKMNKAAISMAGGNYKTKVEIHSRDEIGDLAGSLNYLATKLNDNIQDLQGEKGKLESVVTSISEGIIAVDNKGKIILLNPVAESLLHKEAGDVIGEEIDKLEAGESVTSLFKKVITEGGIQHDKFIFNKRNFSLTNAPILDEHKKILGVVGVIRDISEIERVEQLRRDFVANVSHELRAPITVIRGYVDCLIDEVLDESHTPGYYYNIIKKESLRLERLIEDLMELSLLQSGKVVLYLEEVDLTLLAREVVAKMYNKASLKKIKIHSIDPNTEVLAYCDADRIEQLLVILLDNAIKHTAAQGTISLEVKELEDKVYLAVRDTGEGIPAGEIPHIFERFYKVDKSRKRQENGGTGIGLSLAKVIAELHNTNIEVISEIGIGSTFMFCLDKPQQV